MSRKKFLFLFRALADQKKAENDAIKKAQKGSTSKPSGKKKYLGNI